MKKNIKIVSLVVSMLLLIGCVIGISVSADATPSIEIAQKNISYEGAVKTLYAIRTENADGYTAKINFYEADPAKGAEIAYTKGVGGQITLGEETFDVVFSNGFSPENLRKSIYAVPVLVDGEGNVVATGATVEYSPYIYAMNRFSKSATKDQLTLYTALLDYGAAVQRVLCTADEVAANGGYADEYYEIDAKYAFANDLENKKNFKSGTFSKADIESGAIRAGDMYDYAGFAAWADADGNAISLSKQTLTADDVAPGRSTVVALFGRFDTVKTKADDFTDGNNLEILSHNIATVGNGMSTDFAYDDVQGTSSLIDADGVVTYTKVKVPVDAVGEGQDAATANYQYFRIWGGLSVQDVYVADFDIKFTNVSGDDTFQLAFEGWTTSYSALHNAVITPSEEKDENGYAKSLKLGNATLLSDTNYKIHAEWFTDADVMKIYVDGALAYSYKAEEPVTKDNSYTSFRFVADQGVEAIITLDNMSISTTCIHSEHREDTQIAGAYMGNHYFKKICNECNIPDSDLLYQVADNKGNGKYFTDSTACGAKVDVGVDTLKVNHGNKGGITHGVAEDGTYTVESKAWDFITMIPGGNPVTLENGDTLIFEFDIMYDELVAHNTADYEAYGDYIFMGVTKAANGSNNDGLINGNGSQINFYDNYAKFNEKAIFAMDVWHNVRIEYTIAEDGTSANYKVFVDNAEAPVINNEYTSDKLPIQYTIYGLLVQGSRGHEILKFDNFFMGKLGNKCEYVVNMDNASSYLGNGVFAMSCNKCGSRGEETFTVDTDASKGTGAFYADSTITAGKADVDTAKPTVTWGKNNGGLAYDLNDGTLNITSISWAYLTFASSSSITLAAGEKFVQEFDFMYDGADNLSDKGSRVYVGLANSATGSNSALISSGGDSIFVKENYAYFTLDKNGDNAATNMLTKLYEDIWYNVKVEYIISDDGASATYNIYVNGVLESTVIDATPATTIAGWLVQPSRQAEETVYFKFDNFYMGKVCSEHNYEDVEISGTAFKCFNENNVAVFYTKQCTNCGNFGTETVEYTGVTLGQGTYYADATKDGKREDYENVTVGTSSNQTLNGTNNPATNNFYSIATIGDNKVMNFNGSNWSTSVVRPKDTTRIEFANGDKLVMEFDLRIDESGHPSYPSDKIAAKINFANTYKASDSKMVSDQIALTVADNGKDTVLGNTTLVKGVWYNVRFELTVGGDLSIYVNGELSQTTSGYSYAWSEMAWYGLGVITRGTLNMTIDNMYMANLSAVTETPEATE